MTDTTRNDPPAPTHDTSFESVLAARLSRRTLLQGSFGLAASTFIGAGLTACGGSSGRLDDKELKLNFGAIAKSRTDIVVVPSGEVGGEMS